ncbi:hypothetical protein [Nitrosopumilus sp. b2]|uniref:hypothetical protein n=1 Tax=Nitrosopumilus sp. b2 TaxID=2109908 RepID=UPI0015F4C70F|nr:hypothetical protein [Nitrosopumilus sp. b2]KAF6245441.1 hypothetical protein C6989_03140 [Nitrosopumilus sp. b2]
MKTRLLITIGIVVMICVFVSAFLISSDQFTNKNTSGRFNYQNSEQVISDTYLGKNVNQWQNESNESLMDYYEKEGRDEFFTKLGALVIKNAMMIELDKQNIEVANPDFNVYSGMVLTSLPPHVSFEAFVNGTDGNTYRLSGMTMRAQASYPVGISEVDFFDTSIKLPPKSSLSTNNTIIIREETDNQPRVYPHNFLVQGDEEIKVKFENKHLVPIRIQGDGNWQNPDWYGPTIFPLSDATMTFDSPGIYEWHSRTLPAPGSIASDHMGGGTIFIIPNNVDDMTVEDKHETGAAILQNSEIPWNEMWTNDKGIMIGFNRAIYDTIPNADEYYVQRAQQLIPFDVSIIIEKWN